MNDDAAMPKTMLAPGDAPRRDAPASSLDPVGLRVVEAIRTRLLQGPEWTEEHEDGFSWWSYRFRQRFRVEGPIELEGLPTWWASFEMDVLAGLTGPDERTGFIAMAANRVSNLFETVLEEGRLRHRLRLYLLPETLDHRVALLTDRALLSNVEAHRMADAFVEQAGDMGLETERLRADESSHPVLGARPDPDAILGVPVQIFLPLGQVPPPPERRPDLEAAAEMLRSMPWHRIDVRHLSSGPDGLRAIFAVDGALGSYALQLGVRHPALGLGALSLLHITTPDLLRRRDGETLFDAARRTSDTLNAAEWRTWEPLLSLGAWVPRRKPGTDADDDDAPVALAYPTFHPNATLVPGLASELVSDAARRFAWVAGATVGRSTFSS